MDILLKITGTAQTDTVDTTETLTRGTFHRHGETLYIFYDGADDETPELITRHRIVIDGDRVEVQKRGAIQTMMVTQPGELNQCDYATPFGILRLDFYGISVDVEQTESCVRIRMSYEIRIDGTVVSENELLIEAFPTEENATMLPSPDCEGIKEDTTAL